MRQSGTRPPRLTVEAYLLVFRFPEFSKPRDRPMESLHEAIRLEVRDAGQRDQLCALAGFLQLRDTRFGWAKWYDLVIAGMNGQNREMPRRRRSRRTARHGYHSAETIRILLRNVPGACA